MSNINKIKIIKEKIGFNILKQLKQGVPPKIVIPKRSSDNVEYDPVKKTLNIKDKTMTRELKNVGTIRPFMQTTLVGCCIVDALKANQPLTTRAIYYNKNFTLPGSKKDAFASQGESDSVIQDIELITGIVREDLGIITKVKGAVVGNMKIRSGGDLIDCSKQGDGAWFIPTTIGDARIVSVDAKFVLIVEKDTVFSALNTMKPKFWKKSNCLLMHGGGQPDRSTRRLAKRLSEEQNLPVYVLMDADPWGWDIGNVYRCGSVGLAYVADKLTCPRAKFIGLYPSDIIKYQIPRTGIKKATKRDIKRTKEQLKYPWFKSEKWQKELKLFISKQDKIEIDSLSTKGFRFLADEYIPEKIEE